MDITITEYCVADLIYHLSNNPKNDGWCTTSKDWIGKQLGMSKRNINIIINKLLEKNILEKKEGIVHKSRGNYLRATLDWYERTLIKGGNETSQDNEKVGKVFSKRWEKSSHNKDIYNKDNKTITNVIEQSFGNEDINLVIKKLYDYLQVKPLRVKQQRWATQRLLNRYGLDKTLALVDAQIWLTGHDQYAYKVNSVADLWNKQNDNLLAIKKSKNNQLTRI